MTEKRWPPPPDLESIESLIAEADIEGFLAEGAPADEYDVEAEELFRAIEHLSVDHLTAANLLPHIEIVWQRAFALNDGTMLERRPALEALARQIERFFGPGAKPQVRGL